MLPLSFTLSRTSVLLLDPLVRVQGSLCALGHSASWGYGKALIPNELGLILAVPFAKNLTLENLNFLSLFFLIQL